MDENNSKWTLSNTFGYISSIFQPVDAPEEWNTEDIDKALITKISGGDQFLAKIRTVREAIVAQIDEISLQSSNIRSQYENNKKMMDRKVQEIRNDLENFYNSIDTINHGATKNGVTENNDEDPNVQVLADVNKILDFAKELQYKLGIDNLFDHVSTTGVQITTNYFKARSMNQTILDQVARCEDQKQPLQKQLIKIDDSIEQVNKKISLIKRFKTDYTEIITENKGPVVSGAPIHLLKEVADNT